MRDAAPQPDPHQCPRLSESLRRSIADPATDPDVKWWFEKILAGDVDDDGNPLPPLPMPAAKAEPVVVAAKLPPTRRKRGGADKREAG